MKEMILPESRVPIAGEFDCIVCGCGLSGAAAAWNAAARGVKTAVIECSGKLGGVPSSGMLGIVSGLRLEKERAVSGGFFQELCRRTPGLTPEEIRDSWRIRFDPEILAMNLLEMLLEKQVRVFIRTVLVAARSENGCLSSVVTSSKAGLEAWQAKIFVDGTGDGDLAVMAGCPYEYGREKDGKVQSSSLTFKLGGIDMHRIPENMVEATRIWRATQHRTATNHTVITYLPGTMGEAAVNMTHILNCHPLTHEGELAIRREGTLQAYEIAAFFREHLPGFEKCYVSAIAMQPGVRESRRITGDYLLTEEDVISGRDFPDEIARGAWGIDIHEPDKIHGETPAPHFCLTRTYGIPYRCIIPRTIENLYVAGRPISADHRAFSSSRINGSCLAVGEAIGTAVPMAIEAGDTRRIDVLGLQQELIAGGAVVHRFLIE